MPRELKIAAAGLKDLKNGAMGCPKWRINNQKQNRNSVLCGTTNDFYGLRALRTYALRAQSPTAGYRVGDEERQSPSGYWLVSWHPKSRYNNQKGDTLR